MDFIDGYRLARIVEALDARDDWDVAGTMALQVDQLCLPWREMRERRAGACPPSGSEASRQALATAGGVGRRAARRIAGARRCTSCLSARWRSAIAARQGAAFATAGRWARATSRVVGGSMLGSQRAGHLVRLLREQPAGWFARPQG